MFIFITALRHPKNAKNYGKVIELLEHTLTSVCNQTNTDFKVIVVCNEIPEIKVKDQRIIFHQVGFPPPSEKDHSSALSAEPKFRDKGTKYLSGLLLAKKFNPEYVFIIDSDDWINVIIIEYIKSKPHHPVWYVDKGYFVNYNLKEFKRKSGLTRYCGSTFIYDYNILLKEVDISGDINEFSTQDELIKSTSEYFVQKVLSNHTLNFKYFQNCGYDLKKIPLRSICWVQGTGENASGAAGGDAGIPINKEFCRKFGLDKSLVNEMAVSIYIHIRELLGSLYSSYQWWRSRVTGKNRF